MLYIQNMKLEEKVCAARGDETFQKLPDNKPIIL